MRERARTSFGGHRLQHALRGQTGGPKCFDTLLLRHRANPGELFLVGALMCRPHLLDPFVNLLRHEAKATPLRSSMQCVGITRFPGEYWPRGRLTWAWPAEIPRP